MSRKRMPRLPPVESDPLDILPKRILRAPPAPPAPRWQATSVSSPFVLLGLVSATKPRRDALRCNWIRALIAIGGGAARVKFIVGEGAPDKASVDVLAVPVGEQLLLRRFRGGNHKKIKGVSSYSTYSLYLKTNHFLRYAATQREDVVVLGDDDIFVQPHALLAYSWSLLQAGRAGLHNATFGSGGTGGVDGPETGGADTRGDGGAHWYAGRFDWYSWRTETLQATGYWRAMRGALYGAQQSFRNCSPRGHGWIYSSDGKRVLREAQARARGDERCVGPFAFAKGPLVLLSAPAVRWVVASPGFDADVTQAARIANGTRPYGRPIERVAQDVQLGYWLSRHPSLRYFSLPRKTGWADAFVEVTDLRRLLIGHRIPWDQLGWLTGRTERMWRASSHTRLHLECAGALCPNGQCAHAQGQVACAVELMLPPLPVDVDAACANCACWDGAAVTKSPGAVQMTQSQRLGLSGGLCNYTRGSVPKLPAQCWDGDAG